MGKRGRKVIEWTIGNWSLPKHQTCAKCKAELVFNRRKWYEENHEAENPQKLFEAFVCRECSGEKKTAKRGRKAIEWTIGKWTLPRKRTCCTCGHEASFNRRQWMADYENEHRGEDPKILFESYRCTGCTGGRGRRPKRTEECVAAAEEALGYNPSDPLTVNPSPYLRQVGMSLNGHFFTIQMERNAMIPIHVFCEVDDLREFPNLVLKGNAPKSAWDKAPVYDLISIDKVYHRLVDSCEMEEELEEEEELELV